MRRFLLPYLLMAMVLGSCNHAKTIGSGISSGAGYIGRPVVTGSKKLANATVTGSRVVADATVAGTKKMASATVSGAKSLASGATRLITFGSANRKPPPAPLAPAEPKKDQDPSLPSNHQFPKTGLLVTETELGPDATRLETTAVNLGGGWILNGTNTAYRLEPGADDPTALLVKGKPATASLTSEGITTTASAREIHYHASNQVMTLRGNPVLASSSTRVVGTGANTLIKIHLPTGSISIGGPASWRSE